MSKVGFIGCGNMGGALARAAAKTTWPKDLVLANRTLSKAQSLAAELGCTATRDNKEIAADCVWIFLGVKPQMMPDMLAEIAPVLAARKDRFVLVSMAAGLSMQKIRAMAGGEYPVIRIMPNTPAAIGQGMLQYAVLGADEKEEQAFVELMSPAGRLDRLDEKLIDAASSVSGCGPAFAYLFLEALADGGVACGLPRAKAVEYAAQMLAGSAQMVLQSGQNPGALKDAVCSPGGTTIQGVRKLEESAFRGAAMDAVIAAYEKTLELGK